MECLVQDISQESRLRYRSASQLQSARWWSSENGTNTNQSDASVVEEIPVKKRTPLAEFLTAVHSGCNRPQRGSYSRAFCIHHGGIGDCAAGRDTGRINRNAG